MVRSDEIKKELLAANPQDGFGENRDKKYPMPEFTYTAGSLMLWACFVCWRSLFKYMASWILANSNRFARRPDGLSSYLPGVPIILTTNKNKTNKYKTIVVNRL